MEAVGSRAADDAAVIHPRVRSAADHGPQAQWTSRADEVTAPGGSPVVSRGDRAGPLGPRKRLRAAADAAAPRPGRRGARTRLSRIQQGRKCAVLPAVRFRGHRRNYPSRWRPDVVAYVAAAALSRSTQPLTQP